MPASTDHDDGVTAVIGTVMVLAITVSGIALTLLVGTPAIQKLQDQGALDSVTGSFEAARHAMASMTVVDSSRTVVLPLPAGTLSLGSGSHFLVAVNASAGPTFYVSNWSDWDTPTANNVTLHNCDTPPFVQYANRTSIANTSSGPFSFVQLTGGATFERTEDYRFVCGDAEAWLIHTDRLTWRRSSSGGSVEVHLEAGTIFTQSDGVLFRAAGPRVDEGEGQHFLLSLPVMQNSTSGAFSGGEPSLSLRLEERAVEKALADASSVRIGIHGDLSEAWCNTLLQRGPWYNSGDGCEEKNGVRSVTFNKTTYDPFAFQFGRAVMHGTLHV